MMQINSNFKGFEIFLWKKNVFDLAIERSGLESQCSRKRLFFQRKMLICLKKGIIISTYTYNYKKFWNLYNFTVSYFLTFQHPSVVAREQYVLGAPRRSKENKRYS